MQPRRMSRVDEQVVSVYICTRTCTRGEPDRYRLSATARYRNSHYHDRSWWYQVLIQLIRRH